MHLYHKVQLLVRNRTLCFFQLISVCTIWMRTCIKTPCKFSPLLIAKFTHESWHLHLPEPVRLDTWFTNLCIRHKHEPKWNKMVYPNKIGNTKNVHKLVLVFLLNSALQRPDKTRIKRAAMNLHWWCQFNNARGWNYKELWSGKSRS
jgi:hypothetical protein